MVVVSNLFYKLFALPMVFKVVSTQKCLDKSIKEDSTCLYTGSSFTRIYIQCNILTNSTYKCNQFKKVMHTKCHESRDEVIPIFFTLHFQLKMS